MQNLFDRILTRLIVSGRVTVYWPDGRTSVYRGHADGKAGQPVPELDAAVRITRTSTIRHLLSDPGLAVGEAYVDGGLVPLGCSIYQLLDVLAVNVAENAGAHPTLQLRAWIQGLYRPLAQFNPVARARRNVAHHYDLNGRLYSLFLDRDRQYSCAYFRDGRETLEEAQAAKKRHIAAKLLLDRPNLTVLDIGCGWGGMALTLARDYGARVTGITLSTEQLAEARARAAAEGLSERVRFELLDYRHVTDRFDRIVSVGMFEHVGIDHYRQFFDMVRRCLAPDGTALLHTIGRTDGPASTNAWIAKYIFPGGYAPALSEVLPPIERSGLIVTDVEILRLQYAQTLRHWRRRFAANRDAIAALYDERFCRMFEFYLAASELAFRHYGHVNFQVQLCRSQHAVPLTRDYIAQAERLPATVRQNA